MDSEQKFWLGIVFIVVTGLATIILGCVHLSYNQELHMAQQGYHETTLPGVRGTHWVK